MTTRRLFRRDRLVDDVRAGAHDAEVRRRVVQQGSRRGGRLGLSTIVKQRRVTADEVPQRDEDLVALRDLVGSYATLLHDGGQTETAAATRALLDDPAAHVRVVRPGADIVDQTISTEEPR